MEDIFKKMGQRAFGGPGPSGKRSLSPAGGSAPKKPAAAPSPNGLSQGHQTSPPKEPKIPLIFLDSIADWGTHAPKMAKLVEGDFSAVYRGNNYRIKTTTADHFRALQRYCFSEGLGFYTFSLGRARALKVVISGLPGDTEQLDLIDALTDQGFQVDEATRLRTARGLSRSWLVTLPPDSERDDDCKRASEIWKLTALFHVKINVSLYRRPAGPPQCHRCQGFGHGSVHCGRAERCVRCAGDHRREACPKPKEEAGACCNCGGQHNANYRGCKAYKEARDALRSTRQQTDRPARPVRRKTAEPAPKRKATAAPDTDEEDVPTEAESEPDGFEEVRRRRRRPPRNPANRLPRVAQQPKSKTEEPPPAPRPTQQPRQTPRRRIDWPPAAPLTTPAAPKAEEVAAEERPVTVAMKAPTTAEVAAILADLLRQLTAITTALTQLLPALRQE